MIIFDTDCSLGTPRAEIDDGAALIFLHKLLKKKVAAVTTVHGNTDLLAVVHNVRRLLAFLDWHVPLGVGAAEPLVDDKVWFAEWTAAYGPTPPWPDQPSLLGAVDMMAELIRAHPHQITIVAVGPLTNVALLARTYPELISQVHRVIAMGASFDAAEPQAEFNIRCDPEAAHGVLTAGWPVRLIGLDLTSQISFTRAEFAALPERNQAITLLKEQVPAWIDRLETMGWGDNDSALHDAVATAAYMQPDLFIWQKTGVEVLLSPQEDRGITRRRPVGEQFPTVEVAVGVDAARCKALIWSALN